MVESTRDDSLGRGLTVSVRSRWVNRVIADYCHKNALPDGRRRVA